MKSLKLKLLYSTNYNTSIHTEPFHTVGHCMRRDKDWYYMMRSEFISESFMKVNKSFQENISTIQKKSKRRSIARILLTPAICERLCVKRNDVTCCIHTGSGASPTYQMSDSTFSVKPRIFSTSVLIKPQSLRCLFCFFALFFVNLSSSKLFCEYMLYVS